MKIVNKDLALYLGFKLNKIGNEFSEEELSKLKELSFNQLNSFGEYVEVDIDVLKYTKNLNNLEFRNFEITDNILEEIKNINTLNVLSFKHCIIDDFNKIGEINVDNLSITNNIKLNTNFLIGKQYERLCLNDSDYLDIQNMQDMNELTFLSISNSNVINSDCLKKLTGLNSLFIQNTNIDDISFLLELPNLKEVGIDRELYENNNEIIFELEERGVVFLDNGLIPINNNGRIMK